MKIEMGKKYQVAAGHEVTILATEVLLNGEHRTVGVMQCDSGHELLTWDTEGAYDHFEGLNLVEVKEKKTIWLNMYLAADYDTHPVATFHASRQDADKMAYGRVACIEASYTEGEGLEDVSAEKRGQIQ